MDLTFQIMRADFWQALAQTTTAVMQHGGNLIQSRRKLGLVHSRQEARISKIPLHDTALCKELALDSNSFISPV